LFTNSSEVKYKNSIKKGKLGIADKAYVVTDALRSVLFKNKKPPQYAAKAFKIL
jgi:hypothetical protein